MLTATTTPTIRKMPIPTIATGFLLAIAPLCRRLGEAARACRVRAKARLIAPILCGAGAPTGCRACPISGTQEPFLAPRCGALPVASRESEGNGAPSGAPSVFPPCGGRALCEARSPLGAPSRLFCPRGRASGRGRGPCGPPIRAAFAALRPRRVQPSKADPRSGAGRRPRASRVRGCEPHPRAPHLPHFRIASRSAPHEQVIGI